MNDLGTVADARASAPIDAAVSRIIDHELHTALPALQLLYDTAPIGLAFLSPDCRYLQINQRLTEICGISVADHLGRTVRETVPALADQVELLVKTVLETGVAVTGIEVSGQRPDGAHRVWVTGWHPLKDADGKAVGVNVVAEEITERKRAEKALAASQMALRNLNESLEQRVEAQARERDRIWNVSQDLLVVGDSERRVLAINPAWTAMLGWSEADLLGKTTEWLVHPDDGEKTSAEAARLAEGHKTLRFENRLRHKSGSYRRVSWTAVPDRGRFYAVGRDVTELTRAEEALRELRGELARVSRQTTMGAMTASIAHEINQPLAAIVTNGNVGLRWLARAEPDLDEVRGALRRIVDDGLRAGDVIGGIRGMFGKDRREKSAMAPNDVIREVLALAHAELESHQVVLRTELSEAPEIMADRVQLQQVLHNLIMNAAEAMVSVTDRARLLVVTSGAGEGGDIRITVEDSGPGIDPKDIDRIFHAFFTTKSHGMGMGLAICRSIIEAHGGQLWASPGSPHGVVFHVHLPKAAVAE
jgi:PAS domain S-box-containing protein